MTEFTIPLKVTGEYGLNKIYAGVHWAKRKKDADFIHLLVQNEIRKQRIKEQMYSEVELEFYYNTRLDCSNCAYATKLIEDALKGVFFEDDSKKHVKAIKQAFWEGEGVKVVIKERGK